jgi:hypothetical protein
MMRRLGILAGLATMLALVFATGTSATSDSRQVAILDDCEPVSFNLAVGPDTCLKDGTTTFQTFVGLLAAHTPPAAWRFSPTHLSVAAGGTIEGATAAARITPSPRSPASVVVASNSSTGGSD